MRCRGTWTYSREEGKKGLGRVEYESGWLVMVGGRDNGWGEWRMWRELSCTSRRNERVVWGYSEGGIVEQSGMGKC